MFNVLDLEVYPYVLSHCGYESKRRADGVGKCGSKKLRTDTDSKSTMSGLHNFTSTVTALYSSYYVLKLLKHHISTNKMSTFKLERWPLFSQRASVVLCPLPSRSMIILTMGFSYYNAHLDSLEVATDDSRLTFVTGYCGPILKTSQGPSRSQIGSRCGPHR